MLMVDMVNRRMQKIKNINIIRKLEKLGEGFL